MGGFTSAVHADEMRSRRAPGPGTEKDAQVATVDDVIAVEVECGVVAAPCRQHGTQVCAIDGATAVVVAHAAFGAVVRKAVSIGIRTTVAEAVAEVGVGAPLAGDFFGLEQKWVEVKLELKFKSIVYKIY